MMHVGIIRLLVRPVIKMNSMSTAVVLNMLVLAAVVPANCVQLV